MNPELMTCQRLTAGILYPPLQIQMVDLNRLYAVITERYQYHNLTHLPDGVRMANPTGDCFIQTTRIQVNEAVVHFQASKEKCLDIFQIVSERLNIQKYLTFGIKLTALLPLSKPDAAPQFTEAHLLAIRPDQWALLGPGRKGAGLRVVLHQDGIHDLRIEPFFNDTSQLYIELDVQHPEPFDSLEGIEEKMDSAYNYLFGNLKDFLASF
ncbi:MAG: hypothetical protein QHH26_10765 [Armatimonadota bacterium]|nr:hypothetical protein [Armatimonadota bacterium]